MTKTLIFDISVLTQPGQIPTVVNSQLNCNCDHSECQTDVLLSNWQIDQNFKQNLLRCLKIIHHWDVIYEKKTSQFPFLGKDVPKGKETVVWKKELSASILETGSTNLTTNFDHIDDTPFS